MARVLVFLTLLANGRAAAEPSAAAEAMSAFRRGAAAARRRPKTAGEAYVSGRVYHAALGLRRREHRLT